MLFPTSDKPSLNKPKDKYRQKVFSPCTKGIVMLAISDRLNFINNLQLPASNLTLQSNLLANTTTPPPDDSKGGYVVDGSLVSFVAGLDSQNKSDVLNSTLLAQLAANKKYDREVQTQDWYKYYQSVLEPLGWVIQAFNFDKYNAAGDSFEMNKAVIEILKAIASEDEAAVSQATIDALGALDSGSHGLVLWNSSSSSVTAGNFQIAPCGLSNGSVVMKNASFYFNTTESTTGFLWFTYSTSKMSLYKSTNTMTLDGDIYTKVRQAVIDKLGDKAIQFVADLDI
jgi:hypothetical protein